MIVFLVSTRSIQNREERRVFRASETLFVVDVTVRYTENALYAIKTEVIFVFHYHT